MHPNVATDHPLKIGSLFSGYGGLDLAVEHVFGANTVWFSELSEPVGGVLAHHWPHAPNLGDITSINWSQVAQVDVLTGGFPCQDVSTVGKRAGLTPGTRSGLWAYMATAIDALRPEWVVIENVRGLLSAAALRPPTEGDVHAQRNLDPATLRNLELDPWGLGDDATRPLRAAAAVLGDLADLRMDARWIGLPASLVGAPHPRFRVFILAHRNDAVPNPTRLGLRSGRGDLGEGEGQTRHDRTVASGHPPGDSRTGWLAEQERRIGDGVVADRGHLRRWGRYADAVARWEHITGRRAPAPALLKENAGPRPSPEFVEWLMGLPERWVTEPVTALTANQQITALGNGVLPLQALVAVKRLLTEERRVSSQ